MPSSKIWRLGVFVISISLLFSCKKGGSGSDVHLTNGLLVYLPFNGSILDQSGNNNPTVTTGGSFTSDVKGNPNSAFNGTGNGERVIVTNNGSIKFDTDYTISLDCAINSTLAQGFASMIDNTTGLGPSFIIGINVGDGRGNNDIAFGSVDASSNCSSWGVGYSTVNYSSYTPSIGKWYNIISIYHNGTLSIYINGALITTTPTIGVQAFLCSNSQFIAGGWWQGGPISINGKLDEVRLYNRVLNSDEIQELAKNFK